jgi:hypothetical protein
MQTPTAQAEPETSIPTETTVTNNDPNWKRTVKIRRKAAKRTLPFDLTAEELTLVPSSSLPQAEDIPAARKKPRLEEPLPSTTAEAAKKTASSDVSVGIFPPAADKDDAHAEPVMDTQPNAGAARATGSWTLQEDAKLTSAVTNARKKKYKTNWEAIAALVPGRTNRQCWNRWNDVLDTNIERGSGRKGKWTAVEDIKLKDAVETHGGKNWGAIATLVPGHTKLQCGSRWRTILDTNIDPTMARAGRWTADEDKKLKDVVLTHGSKIWVEIAAVVLGRTKQQCRRRWREDLDPNIDRANGRTGTWSGDEIDKLTNAVRTHSGKNWSLIAALVPGRTQRQCYNRWHDLSDRSIDQASELPGKWAEDEDTKLKDSVT